MLLRAQPQRSRWERWSPRATPVGPGQPVAVVWRSEWLQPSETFVRAHADSLRRWRAVPLGAVRVPSALSRASDRHLYGSGRLDALLYDAFRVGQVSPRLWRVLRTSGAGLVHVHFGTDAVRVAPTCRLLGIPLVVTLHGKDVTSQAAVGGVKGAAYRWRLRRTLRGAAAVVAVSGFIAERAVALGADPARVRVHHSGIPLGPRPDPALPPAPDPPGDAPEAAEAWDVVLVGRLVAKKGALDLLRALSLLREELPGLRAALVGSGPLEARIREAAARDGLDVTLLGTLPPERVAQVVAAARVVAVPSRTAPDGDSEGLPTALLEAAAAARPVVAYRHSGIPEAVDHGRTGLLSPEGDVADLARNLALLLRDPDLRARMGACARERVERDFDIAVRSRALEELYDAVARTAGRTAPRSARTSRGVRTAR